MFSCSTGYYVSPPIDQYLKFKNRCSLLPVSVRVVKTNFDDRTRVTQSLGSTVEYCVQRALNNLQSIRLSRGRIIWLLPRSLPPLPSVSFLSFSVFLYVAGQAYWREREVGKGGGDANQRTARKPGPLWIIQRHSGRAPEILLHWMYSAYFRMLFAELMRKADGPGRNQAVWLEITFSSSLPLPLPPPHSSPLPHWHVTTKLPQFPPTRKPAAECRF